MTQFVTMKSSRFNESHNYVAQILKQNVSLAIVNPQLSFKS